LKKDLINDNHSIKYHNEFYFEMYKNDTPKIKSMKKKLKDRRFVITATESTDQHLKHYMQKAINCLDTLKCLDSNITFKLKRSTLLKLNPVIDLDKNPNWRN